MELKFQSLRELGEQVATFNRTLWNWNKEEKAVTELVTELLIEPYGIEIGIDRNNLVHEVDF